MTTDSLTHELANALCRMPVMTKLQEDLKFTALEDYFNHYKRFNRPLNDDVIDDTGDTLETSTIARK
jgi:hypothetical protein